MYSNVCDSEIAAFTTEIGNLYAYRSMYFRPISPQESQVTLSQDDLIDMALSPQIVSIYLNVFKDNDGSSIFLSKNLGQTTTLP